ncbi:AI-2E family transporter [bacterium]|nr:AI-2E family transporter [bacterium]MCI0680439.1 AI-2E family transporter [bacterium]
MNNNLTIHITPGSFIKGALVLILFYFLYVVRDLVLVILTSVVIASAIEPITNWFGRYKVPRIPAVLLIYIAFSIFFGGLLFLFLPPLLSDTLAAVNEIPEYLEGVSLLNPFGDGARGGGGLDVGDTLAEIRSGIKGLPTDIVEFISFIFGGLLSFILIIIISFYLAVQERGIEDFLKLVTPDTHQDYVVDLWARSQKKIGLWLQGQLLLGLLIGILVYLGLTILGIKYAFSLALLAGIFEIIPIFGPILSAIPAVLFGFSESISLGLMIIGLYVIIQQFENHLIYPLVVRKVVGVSPLLVIISLLVGAELAGFLGIILSVPIAAALVEFTDDLARKKIKVSS